MTLCNNKFRIKHLVLLVFVVMLTIFTVIGASRVMLAFYYYKNGDSVNIKSYKIKLPFGHWAYFGESKITYVIAGKDIGEHSLSAEFFKDTKNIDIQNVTDSCDMLVKNRYTSKGLEGIFYLCKSGDNETLYFQSNDKEIVIRESDYNSSVPEIKEEYEILIKGISKL